MTSIGEIGESELRAHVAWLRRIAARMVGDGAHADDVVQDTLVAALRSPPGLDRDPRPWLFQVLRNFVRKAVRGDSRRRARETSSAPPDAEVVIDAEALVLRHDAIRVVAGLVFELDEPQRSIVLLHVAEDLPLKEIARRRGVPEGTVRWQFQQALATLRGRAARHYRREARDWRLALAPLAHLSRGAPPGAGTSALKGPLLMAAKNQIAGGAVLVVLAVAALASLQRGCGGVKPPGETALRPAAPPSRTSAASPVRLASPGTSAALAGRGPLLSGLVSDSGGGALAGARVLARETVRHPATDTRSDDPFEATTDRDGRYQLRLQPARYQLLAEASGYVAAREILDVDVDVDETRNFRLEPAARLAGRVVTRGKRSPVSGAEVILSRVSDRGEASFPPARSGDEGRFSFDGAPAGEVMLVARKGELVGSLPSITVAAAGRNDGIEIEVAPGLVVEGTVRSGSDGRQPVAAASVGLDSSGRGADPRLSARADRNGRFRIVGVAPGRYRIWASEERHRTVALPVDVFASVTREIVLEPASRVSGSVLTSGGQPASGAWVEASVFAEGRVDRAQSTSRTFADAAGRFVLERLGPGALRLAARAHEETVLVEEPIARGESKELTLRLQAGGARVSGRVFWDDGAPAEGARVRGEQRRGLTRELVVASGADGAFSVGPFVEGDVMLIATTHAEKIAMMMGDRPPPRQANVRVGAGEHRTGIELVVPRRDGVIAGRVLDPDGQPVAGASVHAGVQTGSTRAWRLTTDSARATTDAGGAFTLDALGRGAYTLWITAPHHAELERAGVAAGSRDLVLRLARPASIAGVFAAAGGQRIASYRLVVVSAQGSAGWPQRLADASADARSSRSIADPAGAFHWEGLGPGSYTLVAQARDGRSGTLAVSVRAGEVVTGLRITARDAP